MTPQTNKPTGTPTPMPIFADDEKPDDVDVAVGEEVVDEDGTGVKASVGIEGGVSIWESVAVKTDIDVEAEASVDWQ